MKKYLMLYLALILLVSAFACSKDSGESDLVKFYFRGTIYLRGEPVEGVTVEMEYRDSSGQSGVTWIAHNKDAVTDADGKYEFVLEKSVGVSTTSSWTFRIRCLHPEIGSWTDWKLGGSATRGESGAAVLNVNLE